ncbi:kinase-like domain-containing protein [Tricladium varicosporioides]|nr:kinase-like domain-containing protein [Hymenoscyphus varicosporioides]
MTTTMPASGQAVNEALPTHPQGKDGTAHGKLQASSQRQDKLPDPPEFDGRKAEFHPWLAQVYNKIQVDRSQDSESAQLWYIYSRLGGKARLQVNPWVVVVQGTDAMTLNGLVSQLRLAYDGPQEKQRAADGLSPTDDPGRKHITSLLDQFTINGPNGTHVCLVSDVAGPSVTALTNCPGKTLGSRRLRADLARKIAKQTVEALKFIHSHQLCHGDLTASNLLFKFASINEWSEDEIYQQLGEPRKDPIVTISGCHPGESAPRYIVESAGLVDSQFLAEDILLIDFGQSFPFDDPPQKEGIGIPFPYCAPEVIFDSKVDKYSEIWALGCVLLELRAGQQLFPSWSGGPDEILRQMVQTFGKLPSPWWDAWNKRTDFFNDDGKPRQEWSDGIPRAVEYPMNEIIADIGSEDEEEELRDAETLLEPNGATVPREEATQLRDLLDRIFRWIPEERISLDDMLNHSWFTTKYEA